MWWKDLPKATEGADTDRRAMLFTLYEAMGAPVPAEAWDSMLSGPLIQTGFVPSPALSNALADAAANKRVAEAVLLSLLTLGTIGPEGADRAALTDTIAALRAIGLDREARAVAVEAALGHGI